MVLQYCEGTLVFTGADLISVKEIFTVFSSENLVLTNVMYLARPAIASVPLLYYSKLSLSVHPPLPFAESWGSPFICNTCAPDVYIEIDDLNV